MNLRSVLFSFLLVFTLSVPAFATHIAGAELTYECIGTDRYRITLKMYRDCLGGQAGFDSPITLYIFNANGSLYNTQDVNFNFNPNPVVPENWSACVATPYNLCVEEGVYQTVMTLPSTPDGYDIGWARCCRNGAISNLQDPLCEGVSFLAHVPGSNAVGNDCNTMPAFKKTPPLFLCRGEVFNFDYSAVDSIDGDSLVYAITNPYTGYNFGGQGVGNPNRGGCGNNNNPALGGGNPMGPPPYVNVQFAAGHSYQNPFGPGGYITIDSTTGYLSLLPPNLGIYVVAISVFEYRNGVLLSENKRDFQFHVIDCIPQGDLPIINTNLSGLNTFNDTVYAQAARPFCYDFVVDDTASPFNPLIVDPISVSFGGNGGFPPPYATLITTGQNPVIGQICWTPFCFWIGRTVPMIISARDSLDCPNYNIAFDTVYVKILPSPAAPPVLEPDISNLQHVGDTIYTTVDTSFCFSYKVIDTLGGANLYEQVILKDSAGNVLNQNQTVTSNRVGDTLFVDVCWESYCNIGFLYMFELVGVDEYQCPPTNEDRDTVWYRVLPPPNPPPQFSYDLSQTTHNGDTITARVHENFCFEYLIEDTASSADSLLFQYEIEDVSGAPVPGYRPTASANLSLPTLSGELCWTPVCANVDRLYRLIIYGIQQNKCEITNEVPDTLFIRVIDPLNPPPDLSQDLSQVPVVTNGAVQLEDNEGFCYTFELTDDERPTYLEASARVALANGGVYNGPDPTITLTTVTDSIIQGEICFEVDCDFAGEDFWIIVTGTDTFDCAPGNIVHDTVLVEHTENTPEIVDFCGVSVEPDDASIRLNWQSNSEADLSGYAIFRRRDDESGFSQVGTLGDPQATSWIDTQGIDADNHSYCYYITAVDRCANQSDISETHCTILLNVSANPEDYESFLDWTAYIGWPNGVETYGITASDFNDLTLYQQIDVTSASNLSYRHTQIEEPTYCYRIRADESNPGCGIESWSNDECVTFPPKLFVPTGFTPNGDGLNDNFVMPGVFLEDFEMRIYNRWGTLIFTTTDQATGWDGKVKGREVQEGVYIYQVDGVGFDGQKLSKSGSVTLVR